ncbi:MULTISPECIES: YceD family protein [Mycolicibacterium]|uniref:DUF177 domain-containing protein n=2 Tax=Mycolicibacterium TaxID=1866885 RepID=A1T735_MYCVP|nr:MULTISPECIES: DUF177 domain-containing protein [Mycolicibacterium]ABM12985.1 protein of unknown function DUF177 [Mycolicibacterium vanbaalenii PYR-1]MCV7125986.1 DUF177 domain-containing protein [Mycolicibacterium vanbaalenii PYR-1]MDW5614746.1 DUF177 domain-containing protein [Mycolicibacterium sp. D5.8-2]QZY48221.1 DUF177 domain-containing protein [Mycolicibacterium austroafricanum]UJL26731.1 DUF177 domain-containing protein [Mycolicibacterium vanbaalenii]
MARYVNAAAHRGSRSPLVIDISRLGRRPGSMMTVEETVPSPVRMGVELIAVAEGAPLELNLRLESVSEGVLVTGTVWAPTTGECARCLTPITGEVEIDLTELFAYPDSTTEETTEADEIPRVSRDRGGEGVDLEQSIVDAVGLVLPFSPVCGPDCQGLCPECGVRLADAEPGHHHEQIDPRWAKLAQLREQSAGDDS